MLTLFEVLSFKGWLDVRDILIKSLGPVSIYCKYHIFLTLVVFLGPCYLHPHLHLLRVYDRTHPLCRCGDCQLLRK